MNTVENKAKDIIEDLVTDLAEQNIHIGGSTIINLYMDIVELAENNAKQKNDTPALRSA